MSIHPTLSAPLPWLTAFARLLQKKRQIGKQPPSPLFAKRGLGRLFVLPRTLSFTKEGTRFIAILFVIGIAAINTGNNLLYLIVAMMLSVIVISGILSESTLRDVEVSRTLPKHIFAGISAVATWSILNKKRIFPSFSISIDEFSPNMPKSKGLGKGSENKSPRSSHPAPRLPVFTAESGYIIKLPAGASLIQRCSYTFFQRGLHKLEGFKIKTRFPFGFFLKARRLYMPAEVVVYPNIKPIKQITAAKFLKSGELPKKIKGYGAHLYSIRDYTLSDDSRFIHWKSTAKTTRLMAKELEQEGNKKVQVVFHNSLHELPDFKNKFEDMVEEAASVADYFIRCGFEVGFKSLTRELPCRSGKEQLYRILRELALIEPVAGNKDMPLAVVVMPD